MSELPDHPTLSSTSARKLDHHDDETAPHPPIGDTPGDSIDPDTMLAPPPPSAIDPFNPTVLGGTGDLTADEQRLWLFLQYETYRHRGAGLHPDWAFHVYAAQHDLGAPLTHSAASDHYLSCAGCTYGFQVFAGDTVLNEIPKWREVQSLHSLLNGTIPAAGLARQALEMSYAAGKATLHDTWGFHQVAVREQLGPPLGESYRIMVDDQEYSLQVFAKDTLYSPVPHWSDIRRLGDIAPGPLFHALWSETYKAGGSIYDPQSPFQELAIREKLGTPLTPIYPADFEGVTYQLQVFASDTLYAQPDTAPVCQRTLAQPGRFTATEVPQITPASSTSESSMDALSQQRLTFHLLPIAGRPRISQFFGYTKWAAQNRWDLYKATQGRHSGIDFAVPVGTPLLSIGYGLVVWSGQNVSGISFGAGPRSIIVRYGDIYALYGHISAEKVQKGQFVYPGQEIGYSGWPAGPHLHFEIRPVPEPTLRNRDPNQNPQNAGFPINPIEIFDREWMVYFDQWYARLGGAAHFCIGSLHDQPGIRFGEEVDQRDCVNS